MAALEPLWIDPMADSPHTSYDGSQSVADPNPPTYAAFAPAGSHGGSAQQQRSTILVHQKSPLLLATPPQITRVLAYSHPFILTLSKIAGLVTWTTGDPWQSFLMVAIFWLAILYGDIIMQWAGPIVIVITLIVGMFARRYSPLSSTGWTEDKHTEETNTRHHKSLEEIVDTVKLFTSRCSILIDPFLRLTDFLSTQRTATSATTRPALTTLFIRILLVTPVWILLTLPPFYLITTKRIILSIGTIILSWHSRPARVTRIVLWRSKSVRRACAIVTGLNIGIPESKEPKEKAPPLPPRPKGANEVAARLAAKRKPESPGIQFTYTLYENQRRWLGIGWTASMLAYERAAWTDETLQPTAPPDNFELPEVGGGHARWRWVEGSQWRIDGAEYSKADPSGTESIKGWVFYDNKWRHGRRGVDGWGCYTRRRKWYRDAELVEVTPSTEVTPLPTPRLSTSIPESGSIADTESEATLLDEPLPVDESDSNSMKVRRRRWFRRSSHTKSVTSIATDDSTASSRRSEEAQDVHNPIRHQVRQDQWGMGDDARMQLG